MNDEGKDESSKNKEKAIDEVEFHFEMDPSYRIHAANGAMVGPTPRGEVKIDFFVESTKLPPMIVNKITEGRGLGEVVRRDPDESRIAVRRLQAGVLLSLNQARELAKAITQKVEVIEALLKEATVKGADVSS